MQNTQIRVTGMSCQACVGHVQKALQDVPGVQSAQVDLASGTASVRHQGAADDKLVEAVSEAGYEAEVCIRVSPKPGLTTN